MTRAELNSAGQSTVASSFRKRLEIFRLAYSSWATVLGTILATVALCNLTFRILDASVFEALAWILAAYQKTFHPPIDYLLSFFALQIPAAVKDGLVLYMAASGILYRTLSYQGASPLEMPGPVTWRMRYRYMRGWLSKILIAVFWPCFLQGLLRYPSFLIRSSLGYHGRMPPPRRDLPAAERKEVLDTMLSYTGKDATIICNERQLLGAYALSLLAAVMGLVILNAAVDSLSGGY